MSKNIIINRIFGMGVQILAIFIFLTVFFFTYVKIIEKNAFKDQINWIVDDLVSKDIIEKLKFSDSRKNKVFLIMVNGILDVSKQDIKKESKVDDDKIEKDNTKIFYKSLKGVGYSLLVLLIIIIILRLFRIDIMHSLHFKDAFIMIIFVAFTEFVFLTFVTGKYYSVNRRKVRNDISRSVEQFFKDKKIKNSRL